MLFLSGTAFLTAQRGRRKEQTWSSLMYEYEYSGRGVKIRPQFEEGKKSSFSRSSTLYYTYYSNTSQIYPV